LKSHEIIAVYIENDMKLINILFDVQEQNYWLLK
jgi:hypothetical protein